MRCIVFVELRQFYLRVLGLEDQLAVVHRDGRVIDASASAVRKKAAAGQRLSDAKLILGSKAVYVRFEADQYRADSERWLTGLLQYADGLETVTPASAFIDLSGHPRPEETALTMMDRLRQSERLPLIVGIAPCRWLAQLAAEPCDPRALQMGLMPIEPVRDPRCWLAPRSPDCLTPLPPEVRSKLKSLGVRTVGDIQKMPRSVLERQFRRQGLMIAEAAVGRGFEPMRPNWPPGSFSSVLPLDRCEDALQLDGALAHLAKDAAFHLCAQDQVADALRLYVLLESDQVREGVRTLKRPTQSAREILTGLRQIKEEMILEEPVCQVRLLLTGLKTSALRQGAMTFARRDVSLLSSALNRLQTAYGENVVMPASQMVRTREQRVLKAWGDIYGWK